MGLHSLGTLLSERVSGFMGAFHSHCPGSDLRLGSGWRERWGYFCCLCREEGQGQSWGQLYERRVEGQLSDSVEGIKSFTYFPESETFGVSGLLL